MPAPLTCLRSARKRAHRYSQILKLFSQPEAIPVDHPPAYTEYVNSLCSWANVDFWSALNADCMGRTSYMRALQMKMIVPTIVLAGLYGYAFVKRGTPTGTSMTGHAVMVTFLVFMAVSNAAFSLLNCRELADGKPHLVGDLQARNRMTRIAS